MRGWGCDGRDACRHLVDRQVDVAFEHRIQYAQQSHRAYAKNATLLLRKIASADGSPNEEDGFTVLYHVPHEREAVAAGGIELRQVLLQLRFTNINFSVAMPPHQFVTLTQR